MEGFRVRQKGYITDELTDYALDWLKDEKPKEKPFFLYLTHKAVRANFTPAEGRMTNGTARAGDRAADFPASKVVDEPINRDAH